jgi:archaellum component FlaG (FlaF/FlaG flagellin family)
MLLAGGLTAYGAFSLTGTGQVTVTPPVISAVFVSGQDGTRACQVANSGNSLSCPDVSVQVGNSTTLIFAIKNTGTQTIDLDIQVTPANSSVLDVSAVQSSPTILATGVTGYYTYVLYCLNTGNSGFTISATPQPLPPQV